jgi:small subunit ribosomal protein S20
MANTAQARKRARQAVKQNEHNSSLRSKLRTSIKAVRKAIETGDKDAADKKIAHKNTASRQKSRLSAAIKAMAA